METGARTYTFTATEYEPLLSFTSQSTEYNWNCGPLIAKVRATHVPPPVDESVPKNRLPDAVAFKGNERIDVDEAATACADIQNRCTFTVDDAYSYAYYDKARTVLA